MDDDELIDFLLKDDTVQHMTKKESRSKWIHDYKADVPSSVEVNQVSIQQQQQQRTVPDDEEDDELAIDLDDLILNEPVQQPDKNKKNRRKKKRREVDLKDVDYTFQGTLDKLIQRELEEEREALGTKREKKKGKKKESPGSKTEIKVEEVEGVLSADKKKSKKKEKSNASEVLADKSDISSGGDKENKKRKSRKKSRKNGPDVLDKNIVNSAKDPSQCVSIIDRDNANNVEVKKKPKKRSKSKKSKLDKSLIPSKETEQTHSKRNLEKNGKGMSEQSNNTILNDRSTRRGKKADKEPKRGATKFDLDKIPIAVEF